MRPTELAQVAELAASGESFDFSLANFLDEFYAAPSADALAREPPLLAGVRDDGEVRSGTASSPVSEELGRIQDAYLAATAVELARAFDLPCPPWSRGESRWLHKPWFASSLRALRAVLLHESPPAFRSRNLFVSANALSRA